MTTFQSQSADIFLLLSYRQRPSLLCDRKFLLLLERGHILDLPHNADRSWISDATTHVGLNSDLYTNASNLESERTTCFRFTYAKKAAERKYPDSTTVSKALTKITKLNS
jgi:hypothetical protein